MNDETPELKNSTRAKSLCKKNCGFYGSIEFKDMCSKCYRENNSPAPSSEDLPPSKLKDSKYGFSRAMKRKISETLECLPCSEIKLKQQHQQQQHTQTSPSLQQSPQPPSSDSFISPNATKQTPSAISVNNNNSNQSKNCPPEDRINQESPLEANSTSREPCLDNQSEAKVKESLPSGTETKSAGEPCEKSESSNVSRKVGPNRCHICKKKVGLTGFECHCEKLCCSLHRYPDQHSCQFDYRKKERAKIAQDNPVIQAAKISKI